ncbi:MAG: hypothetical protein HY819_22675 [Acidobacteria bacterium]|nr:hypothetical protein [Acidobacteriota bacterium]
MKEDQNNWSKPADIFGKVIGGDSNIDALVNVRKFLIDNLVLNQQEKENTKEKEGKKKPS